MGNELGLGRSRHGFIFDGTSDAPSIAAQLTRSEDRIELQVPWIVGRDPQRRSWFETTDQHLLPDRIAFADVDGPVALIGCDSLGSTETYPLGAGQDRINVRFAVLGATSADAFETIDGLRSEVEGLGTWVGVRSMNRNNTADSEGRIIGIDLKLEASPPRRIPGAPHTELRPSFSDGPGAHPDQWLITDRMFVETRSRQSTRWRTHIDRHLALRDLVRLAAWAPLNFVGHEAMSRRQPQLTMDGTNTGVVNWLEVETALTGKTETRLAGQTQFLFSFAHTSLAGIGRWMDLCANEVRVVEPVLRILDLEDASLATRMAQVATGLEALGYRQALLDGRGKGAAARERLAAKIGRIVASLKTTIPDEIGDSPQEIADAYNAVKHPDRDLPTRFELDQAYLKGVQLFRIWVAELVGVPPQELARLIEIDPLTLAIVR